MYMHTSAAYSPCRSTNKFASSAGDDSPNKSSGDGRADSLVLCGLRLPRLVFQLDYPKPLLCYRRRQALLGVCIKQTLELCNISLVHLSDVLLARIVFFDAHVHRLTPADVDVGCTRREARLWQTPLSRHDRHHHACGLVDQLGEPLKPVDPLVQLVLPEDVEREQGRPVRDGHADEAQLRRKEGLLLVVTRGLLLLHAARLDCHGATLAHDRIQSLAVDGPCVAELEQLAQSRDLEKQRDAGPKPTAPMRLSRHSLLSHKVRWYIRHESMRVPDVHVLHSLFGLEAFSTFRHKSHSVEPCACLHEAGSQAAKPLRPTVGACTD
mmetsp:Transcript_9937/g.13093  ORF Transcript_9937/g.13093 Transcript_9937/m.13093 type:complete len:324 (-) Transcript_9937:147-1118(-)